MFRLLKLNPPNGWRAVMWELGIVTLGVLVALAAQQWAEARSWRQRADSARAAIKQELGEHYRHAIEWRVVQPCIGAQLDRLEARVLASSTKLARAPLYNDATGGFTIRIPNRTYYDDVWRATLGEGVSSHLGADERQEISKHYRESQIADQFNRRAKSLADRLQVATHPVELDPGVKLSLLESIQELRGLNQSLGNLGGQLVGDITALKMVPVGNFVSDTYGRSGTLAFCRAQGLPMLSSTAAMVPVD